MSTETQNARGRHPLVLAVLLLAACAAPHKPESAPPKKVHPVALQAQFDLNCKRADLRYMKLSDEQWGAVGCGRRARYRRLCDQRLKPGWGRAYDIENRCRWTLDSPVMTQEPSISEAPAADTPNSGI